MRDDPAGVAVLAHGGQPIGVGHLSRASTVAAALDVRTPTTLVLEAERNVVPDWILGSPPRGGLEIMPDRNAARTRLAAASQRGASTLVTDVLGLGPLDHEWARQVGFTHLVHLNDDAVSAYHPDLFVNTDVRPELVPVGPGTSVIQGALFHPIRSEIRALRPDVRPQCREIRHVAVSFGGSDPESATAQLIEELDPDLPFRVSIVCGGAFGADNLRRILAAERSRPNGSVCLVPQEALPSAIGAADVLIGRGGLTSYEAMCVGTGVIVDTNGPMAKTAQAMVDSGVAVPMGDGEVGELVLSMAARAEEVDQAATQAWEFVDGNGADRIAAVVVAL